MTTPLPMTEVPPNWMHPDLRRQLTERHRSRVAQRLERIERCRAVAEAQSQLVSQRLESKRARVEQLESELAVLRDEVAHMEVKDAALRRLRDHVSTQSFYQRSILEKRRVLQRVVGGASAGAATPPAALAKAALLDVSSCIGTHDGYDGCASGLGGGGGAPVEAAHPLDALLLDSADLCLAAPAPCPTEGGEESITTFLRCFAPLFVWSTELGCVPPPLFFDEPCLVEDEDGHTVCGSAGCAYWHRDQLSYLRRSLEHVTRCADTACVRDGRLCGVRMLFASLRAFVRGSSAIDQLCCGVAYALNRIIGLGWHNVILQQHAAGSRSPAPQAGVGSGWGWLAPVVAASASVGAASDLMDLALGRIACEEERDAWEVAVTAVRHGSTPADAFTAHPTALTWRCMSRLLGTDHTKRLWLAETGCSLFPTSPHLQAAHLLSLMEDGSDAEAADCVRVCTEASRLLSSQVAAASFTQQETAYAAVAARYVAFMVAVCAVHVARRDASMALGLLQEVLGGGSSSSTDAGGSGGGYALLPMAQQNLSLFCIALERTGSLHGAELLPLGAISDTALVLSVGFPEEPQEGTVQRLNAQLALLNACQRDGMGPALLDRMKAAAQLSLTRTFSCSMESVESILRKAAPHSEAAQAALWLAYARGLGLVDGFPSAPKVLAEIVERADGQSSCLLTLLLSWHLRSHSVLHSSLLTATGKAATEFLTRHGLTREDGVFPSETSAPLAVAPVEWVACHVLLIEEMADPTAQLEALSKLPLSSVLGREDSTDAVVLLLMAELRAAAALGSTAAARAAMDRCLGFLAVAHGQWWSALDAWVEESVVGVPHWVGLSVYRIVPFLLGGKSGELTLPWRTAVLESASQFHVLHPVLRDSPRTAPKP